MPFPTAFVPRMFFSLLLFLIQFSNIFSQLSNTIVFSGKIVQEAEAERNKTEGEKFAGEMQKKNNFKPQEKKEGEN